MTLMGWIRFAASIAVVFTVQSSVFAQGGAFSRIHCEDRTGGALSGVALDTYEVDGSKVVNFTKKQGFDRPPEERTLDISFAETTSDGVRLRAYDPQDVAFSFYIVAKLATDETNGQLNDSLLMIDGVEITGIVCRAGASPIPLPHFQISSCDYGCDRVGWGYRYCCQICGC